ncbi:gluconate 5-dehydrogenase [Yersinia pseudotuberculosis]|nr:gluconate 5-dehydrogenase [Yersinia pseudotuberculosis]
MDLFTASLRSACSPSRGHFINNLFYFYFYFYFCCCLTL